MTKDSFLARENGQVRHLTDVCVRKDFLENDTTCNSNTLMNDTRYSMASLATQLGVHRSTAKRWFDRANIKPQPGGVTLKELVMAGMKRPGKAFGQEFATPFETLCDSWGFDYRPEQLPDEPIESILSRLDVDSL